MTASGWAHELDARKQRFEDRYGALLAQLSKLAPQLAVFIIAIKI
jgi:hypothetical protein